MSSGPAATEALVAHGVGTITVLHYQGIGDNILALPLLHALRRRFPRARLQLMVPRKRFGLFHGAGLDILFSCSEGHLFLQPPSAVVFDLDTGSPAGSYHQLIRRLECGLLLGFHSPGAALPAAGRALRVDLAERPIWRQYLDLAERLTGSPLPEPEPPLFSCRPEAERMADRVLHGRGDAPVVALAPGAALPEKRWPPSQFRAVTRHLRRVHHALALLVGSPEEQPLADEICEASDAGTLNLMGCTLEEMAALIRRSDLVVANDSVAIHMAAALAVPAVGIYYGRRSSPLVHRPIGRRSTVVFTREAEAAADLLEEVLRHIDRYLAADSWLGNHWHSSARLVRV